MTNESQNSKLHIRGDWQSRRVWVDEVELYPNYSQKVYNHSPDGFNWGYGGSGPAQLALALMLLVAKESEALTLYQHFKFDVVAALPQKDFSIYIDLKEWVKEHTQEN